MSRDDFIDRMPKVELHVHLEGSIRPATLLTLARRHGVDLPADDVDGLRRWFAFRDFPHFVGVYLTCSKCLRDPEDFQLLVRDFAEEQARQNVLYSEVHFTIGTHLANGADGSEIRDALWEAIVDAERREGVRVRLIPDIVRNVPFVWADKTLEWALEGRRHGVVALGLSGFEATHPTEPFRAHFATARAEGLHRTAHAGEHAGPQAVRDALEICDVERIGHGVRAIEDESLVDTLAARGIPLEVCPTSNVCLGVVPDLESHPFDRLRRAGVEVTINSDDPPLFATTLTEEYRRTAATWDYEPAAVADLARGALRHAFLDDDRAQLELRFAAELERAADAALGQRIG